MKKHWASKRKHEINKGKICKEPGCFHVAKAKGYCLNCYMNNIIRKKNEKSTINSPAKNYP